MFTNRGAPRVNAAGAEFVVVLFVVVFHGRDCRSHRAVIRVTVFEIAANAAIAFVVFAAAVVAFISATVFVMISAIVYVVIVAIGCFCSSYLLDLDRCEWKNEVSMLRKVSGIYVKAYGRMAVNIVSHRYMLTFTDHLCECYQLFQISHNADVYRCLLACAIVI
jgi:hypothetical protein